MRRSPFTIGGEPSSAVEERQKDLFLGQNGQEVPKGGQDGHSGAPALEMPGAEQRSLAQNLERGHASDELTLHRLRNGEAEIVGHADLEPLPPPGGWLRVPEFGLDPHLSTAHFDWTGRHIIGP